MIDIRLDEAKSKFIDIRKLQDAADRAELQALSKFGAFVRRRAMSSIRTRKAVSKPGFPPSSHTGILKRFIYFFVERDLKNVVIGPIKLGRGADDAPRLLEYGGSALLRRRDRKQQAKKGNYRQRPFMAPAFAIEIAKAPELLRDSIK